MLWVVTISTTKEILYSQTVLFQSFLDDEVKLSSHSQEKEAKIIKSQKKIKKVLRKPNTFFLIVLIIPWIYLVTPWMNPENLPWEAGKVVLGRKCVRWSVDISGCLIWLTEHDKMTHTGTPPCQRTNGLIAVYGTFSHTIWPFASCGQFVSCSATQTAKEWNKHLSMCRSSCHHRPEGEMF